MCIRHCVNIKAVAICLELTHAVEYNTMAQFCVTSFLIASFLNTALTADTHVTGLLKPLSGSASGLLLFLALLQALNAITATFISIYSAGSHNT